MDYSLEILGEGSLFKALQEWNRTEDLFRSTFGEDSLKEREFLKMKLKQYDLMWYKYKNPLTKDEILLRTMLMAHRKSIRKALYPGILRRLWNRGANYVTYLISGKNVLLQESNDNFRFAENKVFSNREGAGGEQVKQENRIPFGYDLGAKKERLEGNNQRQGL